jgi:hypothetical protein
MVGPVVASRPLFRVSAPRQPGLLRPRRREHRACGQQRRQEATRQAPLARSMRLLHRSFLHAPDPAGADYRLMPRLIDL